MLSSRAKYGLRAAAVLAAAPGQRLNSGEIATRGVIPRKFLEAILVELRNSALIDSRRGPAGGHLLLLPPAEIRIADLIRIFDGPLALTPCTSRTAPGPCKDCPDAEACALRVILQQARDAVANVLETRTLADLARETAFPS